MQLAQLTPGTAFSSVQSLLYYTQRLVTPRRLRRLVSASLCAGVHLREGAPQFGRAIAANCDASLSELNTSGYAPLGMLLDQQQVTDIHNFLQNKTVKELGHLKRAFALDSVPQDVRLADYALQDIVECPHILQLANSPSLLWLASKYIGCKPTISAVWLRWSFPSTSTGEGLQAFHRDSDDWRFLKVFVYLTDVGEQGGPHVYVKGSHRERAPMRLRPYSDDEVEQAFGREQVVSVTGQSGTGFAADTYGIHKGAVPITKPRLLLQIQYSLLPVYAYRYRPVPYSGPINPDRYINRLILQGQGKVDCTVG